MKRLCAIAAIIGAGLFVAFARRLPSEHLRLRSVGRRGALVHESELTRNDPNSEALQRPMLYDTGLPHAVI